MGRLTDTTRRLLHRLHVSASRASAWVNPHPLHLHNARFSSPHELDRLHSHTWLNETGLLLGVSSFHQPLTIRPTARRRELGNLLLCAPPRSGKSLLATSQLLTWPHSAIVNDLKGELYTQTAGYRKTLGKVFVIDPEAVGHRFDPLAGKTTEDALYAAAAHLLHVPNEGANAVFTQREMVMLTQLWLAARAEDDPPFAFTRQCLRDGLRASAAKLDTLSPELSKRFLSVEFEQANFDNRFLNSAWEGLCAKLYPFLTEHVVRSLSGSDVTAADLMTAQTPVTVYLRFTERHLIAQAPLVRLLYGTLTDDLTATYDAAAKEGRQQTCRPVLLLVDEAGRTAIPSLSDHAATVTGRGISLWIAIQSLSQLDAVYGHARAQILRDNMRTQLYYPPDDLKTATYLEERLSRRSAFARSESTREGGGESLGLSEQAVPLLTAWEIQYDLNDDDVLGFHRNRRLPPFRATRMDWRDFSVLTQRAAMAAPPVPVLPPLRHMPVSIWEQIRHDTDKPPYVDPDDPYKKN